MTNTLKNFKRGLLTLSVLLSIGVMTITAVPAHATTCTQGNWELGNQHTCVGMIQTMLNIEGDYIRYYGWARLSVDNQFGSMTRGQVTAFQYYAQIDVDGEVGPQTWEALCDTAVDVIHGLNEMGAYKRASLLLATAGDAGCGI